MIFHTSYMIHSYENIVFYHYFMIDMMTNCGSFSVRIRSWWSKWTIYHSNCCTYAKNSNSNTYLWTQSELNLMRYYEGSEAHFCYNEKLNHKKRFLYCSHVVRIMATNSVLLNKQFLRLKKSVIRISHGPCNMTRDFPCKKNLPSKILSDRKPLLRYCVNPLPKELILYHERSKCHNNDK